MTAKTFSHAVRDRPMPLRRHGSERGRREGAGDQYLDTLAQRHSKRTGIPLEKAREHIDAVAVSARKRHELLDQ
jgi:hypothetical protein